MNSERRRVFPLFVANENDPLFLFNEAVVHLSCFSSHPLADEAEARLSLLRTMYEPANRVSFISGKPFLDSSGKLLIDPDDYFGFGFITSDVSDPLYEFNLKQCRKPELAKWPQKTWLVTELRRLNNSGQWKGCGLTRMIKEIEKL
jgi:hypothetical protein